MLLSDPGKKLIMTKDGMKNLVSKLKGASDKYDMRPDLHF